MGISNIRLRRAGSTRRVGTAAAGWAVAGVLAVAMAGGVAVANTGAAAGGGEAEVAEKVVGKDGAKFAGALRRWGGRVEHAAAVVRTKDGTKSVLVQRGTIAALNGDTMTVRSADGWQGTWTLDDKTRVRSERAKGTRADLAVGDVVAVAGQGSDQAGTARIVREKPDMPAAAS